MVCINWNKRVILSLNLKLLVRSCDIMLNWVNMYMCILESYVMILIYYYESFLSNDVIVFCRI